MKEHKKISKSNYDIVNKYKGVCVQFKANCTTCINQMRVWPTRSFK